MFMMPLRYDSTWSYNSEEGGNANTTERRVCAREIRAVDGQSIRVSVIRCRGREERGTAVAPRVGSLWLLSKKGENSQADREETSRTEERGRAGQQQARNGDRRG